MRLAFVKTLVELAEQDERILLLTGDLGFMALEPFRDRFPDRFFNVGVAEQNMVGLATGLAEAGFIPFVYSIATFATLRPYEFIRNGPVLQQLPVRIVGMGGGYEYGTAGPSHHALEDVGALRLQPGLNVVAPADYQQAESALRQTWHLPGPVYYRLGKDDKKVVPGLEGRFNPGQVEVIQEGTEAAIVVMGSVATEAAAAANLLEREHGLKVRVLVAASINPPPTQSLASQLRGFPLIFTVEAHYAVGGIGSLVSEVVAEHGLGSRVVRCAVREKEALSGSTGSQPFLYRRAGLSSDRLVETILAHLK